MKQKNVLLMVVAVGCGLVAAFLTTQINAKPKVEMVTVLVAAKNLPVGTMLTKADFAKVVSKKTVSKESLPPQFVGTEEELYDKRLTRPMAEGEPFNPVALAKGGVVTLPDGKDMVSFSVSAVDAVAGFVGPGSKVDVLAQINLEGTFEVFPLLIDMLVMTVNQHVTYDAAKGGVFPDVSMISLAVTQEEALLLALAKHRGCHLSLMLRHDGKPLDPNYDMKKVKKLLETNRNPNVFVKSDAERGVPNTNPMGEPDVKPAGAAKAEVVKVLIATEDIAPNTDITMDLIKEKFIVTEWEKDRAPGACSDLTPFLNKAFKFGVAKGHWVTDAMLGAVPPKPAPQDANIESIPKPGPDAQAAEPKKEAPEPKKGTPPKPTRDVAIHTASGTVVHRYQEAKPGEWVLLAVLSPEEAARGAKQPSSATDKPTAPEKAPEPAGDAKKVD